MFKMVVLDLDGTILNNKRHITRNTLDYLTQLKNHNVIITIATGRIYQSALSVTKGAEFANFLITDTGTCIYDLTNKNIIEKNFLHKNVIEKITSYKDDSFLSIDFCTRECIYKLTEEKIQKAGIKTSKDLNFILSFCDYITHAAITLKENVSVIPLYKKIKKEIKEVDVLIMQDSFNEKKWLEILPKYCNKEKAIKKLMKKLKLTKKDIIIFGDGANDIHMIKNCGYGVAMKNALPKVKKVAKDITEEDYNNDGVIKYLKNYVYKNSK